MKLGEILHNSLIPIYQQRREDGAMYKIDFQCESSAAEDAQRRWKRDDKEPEKVENILW